MRQLKFIRNFVVIQVEAAPNSGPMLVVARKLHEEKDRETKLNQQKLEEKNLVNITYVESKLKKINNSRIL